VTLCPVSTGVMTQVNEKVTSDCGKLVYPDFGKIRVDTFSTMEKIGVTRFPQSAVTVTVHLDTGNHEKKTTRETVVTVDCGKQVPCLLCVYFQ
jgi:hypothetical protein